MKNFEIVVNTENFFRRLDKFIRKNYPQIKLASIYKLLRKGYIMVNGVKVKDGAFELNIGDKVDITVHNGAFREENRKSQPVPMKLNIIYEDDRILAIDKPSGIAVHLGKNVNKPTIIEGLMSYGEKNNFTPFVVHRLDKHTSGILVIAKDRETARKLSEIFKSRKVEKYYLTLVKGTIKSDGIIDKPINNSQSLTIYKVLKNYSISTLLEVNIKTGRKHQIRKHMSFINHPVVGDDLYGDWEFNKIFRKTYGLRRYFLHAYKLIFENPFNSKPILLESKLPQDLEEVLKRLEKNI